MFSHIKSLFNTSHWHVTGIVDAPVNDVFKIMLTIHKQNVKPLLHIKGASDPLVENTPYFEINTVARTITIRGGYWYEGIFSALEIENQTRVSYRVIVSSQLIRNRIKHFQ